MWEEAQGLSLAEASKESLSLLWYLTMEKIPDGGFFRVAPTFEDGVQLEQAHHKEDNDGADDAVKQYPIHHGVGRQQLEWYHIRHAARWKRQLL